MPGMKRHVKAAHGLKVYGRVAWPPVYRPTTSPYGGRLRGLQAARLEDMTIRDLRSLARGRGITIHGKNKALLIEELHAEEDGSEWHRTFPHRPPEW